MPEGEDWTFDDNSEAIKDALRKAMKRSAWEIAEGISKEAWKNVPEKTGNLKRSIGSSQAYEEDGKIQAEFWADAEYACVLGSSGHRVLTKEGSKKISGIKVGDEILTQTGDYREVVRVFRFDATEKPEVVTIKTESWYGDSKREITVTRDHKILIQRDGINKWVQAEDIKKTDKMFQRKPPNKGMRDDDAYISRMCQSCGDNFEAPKSWEESVDHTRKFCSRSCYLDVREIEPETTICAWCDEPFEHSPRRDRKYCCWDCKCDDWANSGSPHIGIERSDEAKEKMSKAWEKRMREQPETHPSRIVAKNGHRTGPEEEVESWLQKQGLEYEIQHPIGKRIVDFYIPAWNTYIEADGSYWHQDQEEDIRKDEEILEEDPGSTVVHIHFHSDRFSPKLDPNPLDGSYYITTNPGPKSYASPQIFEPVKVLSVEEWEYEYTRGRPKQLYDIEVEGVHSYVCSGLLISNSAVEYGTAIRGEPFATRSPLLANDWPTIPPGKSTFSEYEIKPKHAKALAFEAFDSSTGEMKTVFAQKVMHPGIEPQPYMRPAIDSARFIWGTPLMRKIFKENLEPFVKDFTGDLGVGMT